MKACPAGLLVSPYPHCPTCISRPQESGWVHPLATVQILPSRQSPLSALHSSTTREKPLGDRNLRRVVRGGGPEIPGVVFPAEHGVWQAARRRRGFPRSEPDTFLQGLYPLERRQACRQVVWP